ncbi:hypothetical protein R3P38DRAFT_2890451, partial [Favolaschia claudopus]
MYALKLALLLAAATASYAYPVSSNNPDLPALLAHKPDSRFSEVIENPRAHKRQVRNADYQANNNPPPSPTPTTTRDSSPPPAASEPTPKDKRADTALWRGSGVSSDSGPGEAGQRRRTITDSSPQKRQIHNADYQANNHPAQQSSPANAPAAAASSSPSKDKRTAFFERSPVVSSSSSPVDHSDAHLEKQSHSRPAVDSKPVNKRAHVVDFGFGEVGWYG